MKEYGGSVLSSYILSLTIQLSRVVDGPENLQQLCITDLVWVIGDLTDFGMSGFSCTNLFIRGMGNRTSHITGYHFFYPFNLKKGGFHAPETTGSESSGLPVLILTVF